MNRRGAYGERMITKGTALNFQYWPRRCPIGLRGAAVGEGAQAEARCAPSWPMLSDHSAECALRFRVG
jgi:hypothetical protein